VLLRVPRPLCGLLLYLRRTLCHHTSLSLLLQTAGEKALCFA
ncbi:MAG: hypothetical protein RL392_2419, partial [Pseudomonadota bacterium]